MGSLTSIKKKLRPLNLYNLNDENIINAELSAYAVALDIINSKLAELERECFISTAESYGLERREKLFGYVRDSLELSKRRDMLIYRGSITSNDFTKEALEEALMASGMEATITEDFKNNSITVNCTNIFDTVKSESEAQVAAKEFMPAHLTATFNFNVGS